MRPIIQGGRGKGREKWKGRRERDMVEGRRGGKRDKSEIAKRVNSEREKGNEEGEEEFDRERRG